MGNSCQLVRENQIASKSNTKRRVKKQVPPPNQQNILEKFDYPLNSKLDQFEEEFFNFSYGPSHKSEKHSKEATLELTLQENLDHKFEYITSYRLYSRSLEAKSQNYLSQLEKDFSKEQKQYEKKYQSYRQINKSRHDLKSILKRNYSYSPQVNKKHVHFKIQSNSMHSSQQEKKSERRKKRNTHYRKQLLLEDSTLLNQFRTLNRQFIML